ncbi:MAG: response regulator, partial [bacterium]|nr:response regulator [bacterium]
MQHGTGAGSARILVVDDSPPTLEVIVRNLKGRGFSVCAASNVAEAIRILESAQLDLVITDVKMPGVSGLELARHVRENFQGMEVVMVTGYSSIKDAVPAGKNGAEQYLGKPFTDEELF